MEDTTRLIIIGLIFLVVAFRLASYLLANRAAAKQGKASNYGYLGGVICPTCGRAFGLHWWSLKLGVGRLDRCPYCKNWNMVNRAPLDALLEAEDAHFQAESAGMTLTNFQEIEGDEYKRLIEDSRYDHS